MTEESSCETKDEKSSSWNFDDLHNEEEINNSDDFFSVLKKSVTKHVYSNEQVTNDKFLSQTQHSTIRVDSSDLISRCKHFLPILTDANRKLLSKIESGENVRVELDSDQEEERAIEMNLMFCPNVETSTSEESDDDNEQVMEKKKQVNIIEIQDNNKSDQIVNN